MSKTPTSPENQPPSGSWLSVVGSGLILLSLFGPWTYSCGGTYRGYELMSPDSSDPISFYVLWSIVIGTAGVFILAIRNLRREYPDSSFIVKLKVFCAVLVIAPGLLITALLLLTSIGFVGWYATLWFLLPITIGAAIWNFRRKPTPKRLSLLFFSLMVLPALDLFWSSSDSSMPFLWGPSVYFFGVSFIVTGAVSDSVPPPQSSPAQ